MYLSREHCLFSPGEAKRNDGEKQRRQVGYDDCEMYGSRGVEI